MTQMKVREGLKEFGEKGNKSLIKELNQLHRQQALLPIQREDTLHEEKKRALWYLMFLKEKRDSSIKARGCTDSTLQWEYTTKSDTSSPKYK